jgi:NAD+ kinase
MNIAVKFEMEDNPFAEFNYALNEISILKYRLENLINEFLK